MLKIWLEKKRRCWRQLRCFERIAHKSYDCCNCNQFIEPGMPYIGEVWVCGKWLMVKRYHNGCPDDPRDEEGELHDHQDRREPYVQEPVENIAQAA